MGVPSQQGRLTLLVPGLLHPPRGAESAFDDCAHLGAWLTEARAAPGPDSLEAALGVAFRAQPGPLSLAALDYLDEVSAEAPDWLAYADPVHLRVDPNRAILFGPQLLELSAEESAELIDSLNRHLAEERLELQLGASGRWYLTGQPAAELCAHPLGEAVGRNAQPFLPFGAGGAYWRRLLNEVQMLLHAHPVNEARTRLGQPAVSSIWPWSAGGLPQSVDSEFSELVGEAPILARLAALAGVPCRAAPGASLGHRLWVHMDLQQAAESGDVEQWRRALIEFDRRWPEFQRSASRGATLCLWPGDGHAYSAGRRRWWPFGRRRWPGFHAWREARA